MKNFLKGLFDQLILMVSFHLHNYAVRIGAVKYLMGGDELDRAYRRLSNNFSGNRKRDEISDFVTKKREDSVTQSRIVQFDVKLVNKTGVSRLVALLNGFLPVARPVVPVLDGTDYKVPLIGGGVEIVASGVPCLVFDDPNAFTSVRACDAVLDDGINGKIYKDGTTATKVIEVITSYGRSVRQFRNFIGKNFPRVKSISIVANDKGAFEGQLILKPLNPFKQTGEEIINLSDFIDPKNLNDKKIVIYPEEKGHKLQLDDQIAILLQMPGLINGTANVEMTIQFNLYEFWNPAENHFLNWLESEAGNTAIANVIINR